MPKANSEIVTIKPVQMKTVEITIAGDSPLIMHAWSEKAKRMMLEAQQGKAKGKAKVIRNPVDEFIQSMYWLEGKPTYPDNATEKECEQAFIEAVSSGAKFGFPCTAIKQAANSTAYRMGWVKNQAGLRGAYFLSGSFGDMVEIKSDTPIMREDMVKIGMGTADLRYRGEFRNWSATFSMTFNVNGGFTVQSLVNIINAGGTCCGIGEWRPEKDGDFGRFHVMTK